eukprot:snap_masked-scaffold_23-processed-gene-0.23-mRNA-1 protein AED:1.00 eAED:1.00 QI:0/0/0/0/1/1/2/0/93
MHKLRNSLGNNLNVDTVAAYKLKNYGVAFYRELTKKISRADHIVQKLFNLFRFTHRLELRESTSIIFYGVIQVRSYKKLTGKNAQRRQRPIFE